jgi:hypothetical protein
MKRSWPTPQGKPVDLTEDEQRVEAEVRSRHGAIMAKLRSNEQIEPTEIDAMGRAAHALHMALKARGREPKHHKYMRKNRGVDPTDVEFYRHVHAVEDLFAFLSDDHANDDPVDLTMGAEFAFRVYVRRWRHDDTYRVTRTRKGWTFRHNDELATGRDGRIAGRPGTGLFHLLDHDSVNYPEELPGYFEWLWEQAADRGLDRDQVQQAINDLAEWVSICERSSPSGIFKSFK